MPIGHQGLEQLTSQPMTRRFPACSRSRSMDGNSMRRPTRSRIPPTPKPRAGETYSSGANVHISTNFGVCLKILSRPILKPHQMSRKHLRTPRMLCVTFIGATLSRELGWNWEQQSGCAGISVFGGKDPHGSGRKLSAIASHRRTPRRTRRLPG